MENFIDKSAQLGEGTKVGRYTVIEKDVKIGKNCTIGNNVTIYAGTQIGDNVAPLATMSPFMPARRLVIMSA